MFTTLLLAGVLAAPPDHQPQIISSLIESLADPDNEVRQYSAMALARYGSTALPALRKSIRDDSKDRRAASAYALGLIGEAAREAIPDLLVALKDEETTVRRQAALALSRIVTSEPTATSLPAAPEPQFPGVPK